jgi:hypothetical protein
MDDPASVSEVVSRLDAMPPLTRRSLGLLAIDVLDVQGVVVAAVDAGGGAAAAGLQPGDVITSAGGQPVTNVAALLAAVAAAAGQQIALGVRDRSGTERTAAVAIQEVPVVVHPSDDSVLANARVLALTGRLGMPASPAPPIEAASLRLNLATAWIRLGNCEAATRELAAVEGAPAATGVPPSVRDAAVGNAQYLSGLCAAATGNAAAAEEAWTKAAQSSGVSFSDGNEPLKELAGKRLSELRSAAPAQ